MRYRALVRLGTVLAGTLALCSCNSSSQPANTATSGTAETAPPAASQKAVAAPAPKPILLDAGTVISVTMDQSISSRDSNPGDNFDASLSAPVIVDGKLVIPSGAKAKGTVTVAKSAGRFKGSAELGVTLESMTVSGRKYPVHTSSFTQASKGRGKRTAIGAGAGAAAGAVIGALAGGGKGAAIGAGAGAGAGTAGAALTGNRDIDLPAETNVTFKLTQPLEIKGR
jgi:hypothetical protein